MTKEKTFQTPSAVGTEAKAFFGAAGPIPDRSADPATIDRVRAEARHFMETQSRFAERLLVHWPQEREHFWQIVPKEVLERLEHPVTLAAEAERRA